MERQEPQEEKEASIRILQLKNNFYWTSEGTKALGEYCVMGYFDALDIKQAGKAKVTEFDTWGQMGELTFQLDKKVSCRMLVCVTEQMEKDEAFWMDSGHILYFITTVRINKSGAAEEERNQIEKKLSKQEDYITYLSYDHSEIIVVTKTNAYRHGIKRVKTIRQVCKAVKTYTVFAVRERALENYESLRQQLQEEKVFCRLHCMVRDYDKAGIFLEKLRDHLGKRNKEDVKIRQFETFGGYDWLVEIDDVLISSVVECYKTGELLTHSNQEYKNAFFNVESEILTIQEEQDGGKLDSETERATDRQIQ